jgi:hypothetical protein
MRYRISQHAWAAGADSVILPGVFDIQEQAERCDPNHLLSINTD